jgi:hypothetical protein
LAAASGVIIPGQRQNVTQDSELLQGAPVEFHALQRFEPVIASGVIVLGGGLDHLAGTPLPVRGDEGASRHWGSASDDDPRTGERRPSAQASASDHRYNGTRPNKRYGGPPPLTAFVANVAHFIG